MNLVLDASVVVEYLAQPAPSFDLEAIGRAGAEFHVPAICDTEVVSALSRRVRLRLSSEDEAREALVDYAAFPLARHLHPRLLARMFELRNNISARDASYVALAEALGGRLMTVDRSLARAARRHTQLTVLP